MIDYQVGPTYKSTRDDICPISFGIEPLILFHMKSLHLVRHMKRLNILVQHKGKYRAHTLNMLKLTISRDELIFGALVINSRRDSYSSASCYRNSWSCPQRINREKKWKTEAASPKLSM